MAMPRPGDPAPDFTLQDDQGRTVRLSDFRGRRVVLFFYPKADTPGCTKEACAFRDDYRAFEDLDVVLLGVSPDTVEDQARFKAKYALPFPLLADADHAVCEAYGVWGERPWGMGVLRTTFLIDEAGRVAHVFENVNPDGHSQEVLEHLRTLASPA